MIESSEHARYEATVRATATAFLVDEALSKVRHDVLSSLTGIGNAAYLLKKHVGSMTPKSEASTTPEELLKMIREQVARATNVLERRVIAPPSRAPHEADVAACVLRVIARAFVPAGVALTASSDFPRVHAAIDPVELEVALGSIVDNALDVGPGEVTVMPTTAAAGHLAIAVVDSGVFAEGYASADAFEAFRSTKPGHLGLGLAVARRIARRWGGAIDANATPAGTTSFVLCLRASGGATS